VAALDPGDLRLLELPRVYVHDTVRAPQVSACLIMKDEAADLADCLASLRAIVDEVVIYDTGSTDGSVALARSLGATVVEGGWHHDFARARNEALALARGTWVLSIDPDERLEIEPGVAGEIRALLGDDPPVDRFVIDLYDLQGSVHAPVRSSSAVPMNRLFRRRRCHWVGALHEQPEARPGQPALRAVALPGVCFLHRGYLDEVVRDRGKWERNLAVATAGLDKLPESAKECFDLGRSLRSVGEHTRAFALFERAADLDDNVVITRAALEFAALTLMETGRAPMASDHLDRLAQLDGGEGPARYLRGWAHVHQQQWAEAAACFEGASGYDDNFTGFRAESLSLGLALAYRGLDRFGDAAGAALDTLRRNPLAMEAWAVLFHCAPAGGPDDLEAARAVPAEHLTPLFAQLATYPASMRERLAEATWQIRPGDRVVLAVASQLAGQLAGERLLEWSARLRASGLAPLCPLPAVAEDGTRTVAERAALLARGVDRFDADDLAAALEGLVGRLHDEELADLLHQAIAGFGGAAASIIVAGATSPARCLLIVGALDAAGFPDEALSVLSHAGELDDEATRRLLGQSPELLGTLRQVAAERGRSEVASLLAA
jgi:tetratricopeptide (TPR) repeat protein